MVDRELPEHEAFSSYVKAEDVEKIADPLELDDEISLMEMVSVVLRHRGAVLRTILLFTGIGLFMALTTSARYSSTASFLPENSRSPLAGAASLAQQFGFSLGTSGSERAPQFYADLVNSNEILRKVVTSSFPVSPTEGGPEEIDLITYYETDGETHEERIAQALYVLTMQDLSVRMDRETAVISFTVTTDDPMLSKGVATLIYELVNDFDLEIGRSQASAQRLFSGGRLTQLTTELLQAEDSLKNFLLENRLFTNSPQLQFEHDRLQRTVFMRQELVTSLAQAFESARIEEVRNTPVITLIESPRVPAVRDPKGRIRTVIVGILAGVISGVFLAFVKNYREESRRKSNPKLDELSSLWSETLSDVTRLFRRSLT